MENSYAVYSALVLMALLTSVTLAILSLGPQTIQEIVYFTMHIDRQVILGNHRDAWTFGAVDPNSGTAVLMELARSLSELRTNCKYI